MKPFTKYNSLKLIREDRPEELDRYRGFASGKRFVVMEKIHGANLEVATDGNEVRFSRRRGPISADEDFYGLSVIKPLLEEKIKAMFEDFRTVINMQYDAADALVAKGERAEYPSIPRDFTTLSIRGEFAGGNYPAEGVAQVKIGGGQVGAGGIWYSQDKSFYAFQVCIDGVEQGVYTMGSMCRSFGIPVAPMLHFGTFEECLAYSREHLEEETVIPMMQPLLKDDGTPLFDNEGNLTALPAIEDNQREGHVIMSVEADYFPDGDRMVFKHKGERFMENKGPRKPRKKPVVVFNEHQQRVFNETLPLLTWERFVSVQSKYDEFQPKDFTKACGLVVQDALDELLNFNNGYSLVRAAWDKVTTKERKQLMGQLGRECALRLRTEFFKG